MHCLSQQLIHKYSKSMQKKNEVFFGKHGITSTSANHLANIAKELIADNEAKLKNITFVTTTIDIVGATASGKTISRGYTEEQLGEVRRLIEEISAMHAFCAWMREAIKAKEEELDTVSNKSYDQWELESGLAPLENPVRYSRHETIDEDDVISEMNIKDRNEYYRLEAYAAAIGKYIHEGGAFAEAREALHNTLMKPYSTEGSGADTIIYAHTPSVEESKVDDVFFDLQKWHRENERELNRMKYAIKIKVRERQNALHAAHREKFIAFEAERKRRELLFLEWQNKETEHISQLKIVIPEALQETYDMLCAMEK